MKIGIVGAGSIGLLFAAYMNGLFDVTVYTRTIGQAERINRNGVRLVKGAGPLTANVRAKALGTGPMDNDLTIIAVKQYQLESVLSHLPAKGALLFLQNGMGHLRLLEQLNVEAIYVGSVEHGALRETPDTVSHNGAGLTRVAVFRGSPDLLEKVASLLSDTFPMKLEPDFYEMLAGKLAANAVINPLTAILGVRNGELVENPRYEKLLEKVFEEAAAILGFKDPQDRLANVKRICRNTSENRSSMLKDLDAGRPTEVDAILGYLLDEADDREMAAPLLRAFYEMIKGKDSNGRESC
ncbi:2-dehydropantoate 2-reductase [Neobacillus piezotolerans]|uniref:2-dehydropantoate 2-reductase n=1 Tax=Neobacillus piezotolerans TaxID=2259171 RepID=A0A3D8GVL4_9BACI|nr:2-dehydropantoate 2-reductase [Neobacillus piezotolerans]RDU38475.1 2-dehydropantoate 2-reductase [Neobacillus piezotolerans]